MDRTYFEKKSKDELIEILNSYQQALSEKNYSTEVNHLEEGFQIIGFDWRYLYVNDAVVKQSKYSREELIGCTMMEKYPGIEKTKLFEALSECMKDRVIKNFENEFNYPDGSKGWFDLSIQPSENGIIVLSVDVTRRKKAELEKKEYIKGLEEIVFMTSHKVRQPVAHIMGISYLLDKTQHSHDDLKKMAAYMKQSAEALDGFTRELVTLVYSLEINAKQPVSRT